MEGRVTGQKMKTGERWGPVDGAQGRETGDMKKTGAKHRAHGLVGG